MNEPNLFDRLEGYAQENFTTETLAYILQTDGQIRRKFLELLLKEKGGGLRAAFKECEIDTQFSYDIGRPDLKITSRKDNRRLIFIEVKTRSLDREGQIQNYLKRGHVAYLTPLREIHSSKSGKFLGHFFWPQVYSIISSIRSRNEIYQQFLQFLEVRHMGPSKPITQGDLSAAVNAVTVIRKFQEIVTSVRERVAPKWIDLFGPNMGAKGVSDGIGNDSLPFWWYRTKGWRKKGSGGFYLEIGIEVDQKSLLPQFFLDIGSGQGKFARTFESDHEKTFQSLRELGWKKDPEIPGWDWGYAKFFSLSTGTIDKVADKQAKNVLLATKDLREVIKKMKSKI